MRIATFNLLNGRTPGEDAVDEDRLRRAIAALDADVLALQEVDRDQPRSGGLDLAAIAADAMGAADHRFVAALSGEPSDWRGFTGEEPEGTAAYGIALLSRFPVTAWHVVRLPPAGIRVPHLSAGRVRPEWVRDEPRVAVLADLETPNGPMRVVTTHLSFLPVSSGRQLRRLIRSLGRSPGPMVLTGDLNMSPRRAGRITGMSALATDPTFPVPHPTLQLDHILCTEPLVTRAAGPRPMGISDHFALVADLS